MGGKLLRLFVESGPKRINNGGEVFLSHTQQNVFIISLTACFDLEKPSSGDT
jgi:hypothetical protein